MQCIFVIECGPGMMVSLPLSQTSPTAAASAAAALTRLDGAKCLAETVAAELARAPPHSMMPVELSLFCSGIHESSALVHAQLDDDASCAHLPSFESKVRNLTAADASSRGQVPVSLSLEACLEEALDLLDARRAKREADAFGRGWTPWAAMPVHIYIISCASSLATTRNASGTNDAPNHSTFARSQLLPSLTRLFDGRSYWDLNVVLLSIGDSAAPRTLPPAVEVLMKETHGVTIPCPTLRDAMSAAAPLAAFARRSAPPSGPLVRLEFLAPGLSTSLTTACSIKDLTNTLGPAVETAIHWCIPEAVCWRGALDGLLRRPTCPRLRLGTSNGNTTPAAHHGVGVHNASDPTSPQLQEFLQIANLIHFPYDCYSITPPGMIEFQGGQTHRQEDWQAVFTTLHDKLSTSSSSSKDVVWIPVYIDQQPISNVSHGGPGSSKGKDAPVVALVAHAAPVAVLTGMFGLRRSAIGATMMGGWEAELILMPPNFHILLPLLRTVVQAVPTVGGGGVNSSILSQQWRQSISSYMQSVPTYFYATLSTALKAYSLQLCVPRGPEVQIFSRGLWAHLKRLQTRSAEGLGLWAQARRDNEAMKKWTKDEYDLNKPLDLSVQRETRGIRDVPYKFVGYGDACLPAGETVDAPSLGHLRLVGQDANIFRRRMKYNGGPDLDPWPASPCTLLLNPPPELLGTAPRIAAISAPLESDDLFSVWERMRRDVFGGSVGRTATGLHVEGCEGSVGRIRSFPCETASLQESGAWSPGTKRRKLEGSAMSRLHPDDVAEWRLWFNALGADLVPRYTSRSMGHYAAVLSRREALRDPTAVRPSMEPSATGEPNAPLDRGVGFIPPDEDSPEEQARRKYKVHFGNPFAAGGIASRSRRRDSHKAKQEEGAAAKTADVEDERALFLDGVRPGLSQSSAEFSGNVDDKASFLSLFSDTPAPSKGDEERVELPGPVGADIAAARAAARTADEASRPVLLQLPPLPRKDRGSRGGVNRGDLRAGETTAVAEVVIPTTRLMPEQSSVNTPTIATSSTNILPNAAAASVAATPAHASISVVASPAVVSSSGGSPWVVRHSSKHNCSYWFNVLDGSSQWTKPHDAE